MQWSPEENAGFSRTQKTVHPLISQGLYAYQHVNVETQRRTPDSLLNWLTALIRLRQECVEIGWGDWQIIESNVPQVLCMHYIWKESSLLILHNFDEKAHEVILQSKENKTARLVDMMTIRESTADEKGQHRIALEAYGYRWFRAGNLSHSLQKGKM